MFRKNLGFLRSVGAERSRERVKSTPLDSTGNFRKTPLSAVVSGIVPTSAESAEPLRHALWVL